MNRKNKISTGKLLRSLILLVMMGWMGSAWAQTEKLLYSTDFTEWNDINRKTAINKTVTQWTDYSKEKLTFTLNGVGVDPKGWQSKFSNYTGYMITAKYTGEYSKSEPSAVTSTLNSITKIELTQAATGPDRGIKVSVKGDGDGDWVVLHAKPIQTTTGETLSLDVKRTNCQIKFESFALNQNAYIVDLKIYGNVEVKSNYKVTYYDTDGTTSLGSESVTANSNLTYNTEYTNQVKQNVPSGSAFRGWFNGVGPSAEKVAEGTPVDMDLNLYAKVTPIETATDGSEYTYDLTKNNFYQEDHELIEINGGKYHNDGWIFENEGTILLKVAKNAHIEMTTSTGTTTRDYTGGVPTTLTLDIPAGTVVKNLQVKNYIPVYVSFDLKDNQGQCPEQILCEPSTGKAKLPSNNLIYREGYTFTGWTDANETKIYPAGEEVVFTESTTLHPMMVQNTIDITDTNTRLTVSWDFDHTKAPAISSKKWSSKTMPYTHTVTIENKKRDITLMMDVTTSGAKIENTDSEINDFEGEGGQFNNGTQFSLPAVYGMTLTIYASTKVDNRYNISTNFGTAEDDAKVTVSDGTNHIDGTISEDKKSITFTYNGDAKNINIQIVQAGIQAKTWGFFRNFTITYPVLPNVVITKTISNADKDTYPNEKPENAGTVQITKQTVEGNTGARYKVGDKVTITTTPSTCYTFQEFKQGDNSLAATSSFEYTVQKGINNIEVIYERQKLYQVVVKPSDPSLGTVSLSPKYDNFYNEKYNDKGEVTQIECWYTEGTEVVATGEAITDYMLDYWKKEDGTLSNGISYSFTVETSNQTLTAHFALGHLGSVNFVIPDGLLVNGKDQKKDFKNAISVTPNSMNNVRSFTIPTNYTLFKSIGDNGNAVEQYYTLRHWKDDKNNIYELGTSHSFGKEGDIINLVPVFEQNLATQNNRTNNPVIRYDFARKVKEYDDPTAKETRKVCAQPVNIGKDQQVFWTTKVWVEVREAGKDKPHWRDVALWCDTGKKGYIKNGQFDNWCAFGPGTTLWFPSGTGTKISLMSYSKITSTTIDDSVPTLDRERTNSERKKAGLPTLEEEEKGAKSYMYVYTHTTQNPNLRPAIKIGDDYSYYQWLELSTLAANWVELHTETNDDSRGIIQDIKPVTTGESHEYRKLEDGGLAFHKGERVKMTFNRKKGYELDKILDPDKLDENGEPVAVLKMNDDGTVNMVGFDDGTTTKPVDKNTDDSWGTASSTVFVLRKAEKNQSGKDQSGKECYLTSDSIRTQYELEFDITTHRRLQVCFKEMKNTYYITYNAGEYAEGTSPEATWVEAGDQFAVPKNKTLYYEGNTLDHWVDGAGNEYKIGKSYEAPKKFIRMFPVFKPNEFNILNLQQEATATWNFAKSYGAPTINYEGTKGILVTQLETEDENGKKLSMDLKITLDGSKGKFNNVSSVDHPERIQINQGSVVEFPSTKDCVAKWTATEDNKKLTIAGETVTLSNQEASVTCSGASSIQKVEFNQGEGAYSKSFSVTYKPQTATKATIESLTCKGTTLNATTIQNMMSTDKCVTFTLSPWVNDNDTIPAVTGTATENGTVTVTKATVLSPECVATVKTQSGIVVETYPIKFKFNTPEDAPTLNSLTVNGTIYTDNNNIELKDVPRSGVIKLNFNRPMKATNFTYENASGTVSSSTAIGKEQIIKYWDLPSEGKVELTIMPTGDIYGGAYGQVITLILNVAREETIYHRHTFDFIVGRDGNMDEAIKAANNNNKTDHRYYIFVPDGKYQLTGNTTISFTEDPVDENGDSRPDMNGQNNHMTDIIKSNISLIGQSKEGVTIWNRPIVEGISYTATLNLVKDTKDFYAQDLTLENQFKYWGALGGSSGAGRAVAFCDRGNRSVLKNVALKSYQDTYYSSNSNADYRGYFENCDLWGVVDWICGNGDIWFEKCNLIVRDRTGNNIVASGTEKNQAWGYVFNNCTIRPETDKPTQFKGNDWTLARPWNNSPACTFLNTKMYTQPQTYGWNKMTEGLVVRFHEYNSVDESDTPIPLATRSLAACSPAPGSDDCILTNTSDYNIRNVMSGTDAFEPQELCKQIDAESGLQSKKDEELEDKEKVDTENHIIWKDSISTNDNLLQWKHQKEALCYFIFKLDEETGKWIYKVNTIENQINLNDYGNGFYCIRAANQRGGLGGATKAIEYVLADPYELDIKKVEGFKEGDKEYGWSTICLPFNAKVPTEVIAYAATAHNMNDSTSLVTDLTMTLTPVTVINANKGYVVYGQEGKHYFHPTSNESSAATILKGNPKNEAIPVENNKGYVLSYKSTWGIGFYKFTGSTLAANRAWLPKEMVSQNNQDNLALGKHSIRFAIAPGATSIASPTLQKKDEKEVIYNLNGQQVDKASARGGIFISSQKGKFYKASGSSRGR
ncbi:pectinesterase family protein [Segatella copri]|uniref:pectinesterase family protein n=1 Tax=Segatella copri TaxID=165179 RepID=UPI00294B1E92|nr:pectinesterase family protein [Segatella copri]WOG05007.1 pectinesterase family protein [Segatella copri]